MVRQGPFKSPKLIPFSQLSIWYQVEYQTLWEIMEICSVWVALGTDLTIILFLRDQSTGSRQFWLQISWKFLSWEKVRFYLLKIQQNWVKISERLEIALIRILNLIWLIVILDGSWLLICLLEHQCCCKVRIMNWLSTYRGSHRWVTLMCVSLGPSGSL